MNDTLISYLVVFVIAFVAPLVLTIFSIKFPPEWVKDSIVEPKWVKLNLFGLVSASLMMIIVGFIYSGFIPQYSFMAVLSIGVLFYTLVQTAVTDFTFRLADRRLLRLANLISASAGIWFLASYTNKIMLLTYVLLFLFFSMMLFIPKLGQSDARALQLVVLSAMPVIGLQSFQIGFLVAAITIILYGITKSLKENGNLSGLFTKLSLPLVPFIIAPFAVMVLIHPLIQG